MTLVPQSWTIMQVVAKFSCITGCMVRQSRKFMKRRNYLEYLILKQAKKMPKETWCDDKFSCLIPGKKDFVSIGKNKQEQKRLILVNLKELFARFKSHNHNVNIRFSKLCSWWPNWCTLIDPCGSYSVCACSIYENTALLVNALKLGV